MSERASLRLALGRRVTPPAPLQLGVSESSLQPIHQFNSTQSVSLTPPPPPTHGTSPPGNSPVFIKSRNSEDRDPAFNYPAMRPRVNSLGGGYGQSIISSRSSESPSRSSRHSKSAGVLPDPFEDNFLEENSFIPILEGTLKKRSPKGLKLWQSRYCVLYSDAFQYFKRKGDMESKGSLPLHAVKFVHQINSNGRNTNRFDIVVGEKSIARTFHMEASTVSEAETWVDAITQTMKKWCNAVSDTLLENGGNSIINSEKFWKGDRSRVESIRAVQNINRQLSAPGTHLAVTPTASAVVHNSNTSSPQPISPPPISPLFAAPTLHTPPSVSSARNSGSRFAFPSERNSLSVLYSELCITIVKTLAETTIGSIYACRDRKTANGWYNLHAVKKTDPHVSEISTLFSTMAELNHPYIHKLLYHGETADRFWGIYTPAFRPEVDSLLAYLHSSRRLPETAVRYCACQILLSLKYLHSRGYRCRQMSPEYFAIDSAGHVILADYFITAPTDVCVNIPPEYIVPEELETTTSDWWRFGVLLYELAVGFPPIRASGQHNITEQIVEQLKDFSSTTLQFPPFVSIPLQSLIRSLLQTDPTQRLGYDEDVENHPFFHDVQWESVAIGEVQSQMPSWIRQRIQQSPPNPSSNMRMGLLSEYDQYLCGPPPINMHREHGTTESMCSIDVHILQGRDLAIPDEPILSPSERRRTADRVNPGTFSGEPMPSSIGVFCVVRVGEQCYASRLVTGKHIANPNFNEQCTILLPSGISNEQLVTIEIHYSRQIMVMQENTSILIGSVQIPVYSIKSSFPAPVLAWHTVIDVSTGLPRGELHAQFIWSQNRDNSNSLVGSSHPQLSHRLFSSVFGTIPDSELAAVEEEFWQQQISPKDDEGEASDVEESVECTAENVSDDDDEPDEETNIETGSGKFGQSNSTGDMISPTSQAPSVSVSLASRQLAIPDTIRCQKDEFDLDLSYITPRVVAMSYPFYKPPPDHNSVQLARQYLQKYHPNSFKVYSLCAEKHYSVSRFGGRAAEYRFPDYSVPCFQMLKSFCQDALTFLEERQGNVVAIHCMNGLNRTCLMVCCLLLLTKSCSNVDEAIATFARQRMRDARVTITPSQRRYLHYFAELLRRKRHSSSTPSPSVHSRANSISFQTSITDITVQSQDSKPLRISHVRISPATFALRSQCYILVFNAWPQHSLLLDSRRFTEDSSLRRPSHFQAQSDPTNLTNSHIDIKFGNEGAIVYDDIHLEVFSYSTATVPVFSVWLHTSFIRDNYSVLRVNDFDFGKNEKKKRDIYRDLRLECYFSSVQ